MEVDELFDAWERAWSGRDPRGFESVCARRRPLRGPAHARAAGRASRALARARAAAVGGDARRAGELDRRPARRTGRSRARRAGCSAPTPGRSGGSTPTGRAVDRARGRLRRARGRAALARARVLRRLRRGDDARRAAQARHGGRAGDADAARVRDQRLTRTGGWSDSGPRSSTSTACAGGRGRRGGRRGCRPATSARAAPAGRRGSRRRRTAAARRPNAARRRARSVAAGPLVAVRGGVQVDHPRAVGQSHAVGVAALRPPASAAATRWSWIAPAHEDRVRAAAVGLQDVRVALADRARAAGGRSCATSARGARSRAAAAASSGGHHGGTSCSSATSHSQPASAAANSFSSDRPGGLRAPSVVEVPGQCPHPTHFITGAELDADRLDSAAPPRRRAQGGAALLAGARRARPSRSCSTSRRPARARRSSPASSSSAGTR